MMLQQHWGLKNGIAWLESMMQSGIVSVEGLCRIVVVAVALHHLHNRKFVAAAAAAVALVGQ